MRWLLEASTHQQSNTVGVYIAFCRRIIKYQALSNTAHLSLYVFYMGAHLLDPVSFERLSAKTKAFL